MHAWALNNIQIKMDLYKINIEARFGKELLRYSTDFHQSFMKTDSGGDCWYANYPGIPIVQICHKLLSG